METDPHHLRADRILLHVLVVRCQAGDEAAFARLLDRFGPRTLGYLERLVGEEAEDVHQELWLEVYRRIAQLTTPAAFVTWLFTVARHRAVDFLRHRRRSRELLDDVATEAAVHGAPSVDADGPGLPDGTADLRAAIAALAPLHREVVVLRYQEELSYAEIAAVVGCSVGTVKSRLHYARHQLQAAMART